MFTKSMLKLLGVFVFLQLILASHLYACNETIYDSGYVQDSYTEQNNVITASKLKHNHWESGGTFTFSETASSIEAWSVGAKYGYESFINVEAGLSVVVSIKAGAKVSIEASGQLSHSDTLSWTESDTSEKQHCKCPVYKSWADKPTEVGHYQKERRIDYCPDPDGVIDLVQPYFFYEGEGTGTYNKEDGVVSHYNFGQTSDGCKDCYNWDNDCPGTP